MKRFILILLTGLMISCNDNDNPVIIDTAIDLSVNNYQGVDLLNPDDPNAFKENNIKIFYIENGKKIEVIKPNLEYPRCFFIFQHEKEYRIRIIANDNRKEEFPITIIQWDEKNADTIKCSIERRANIVVCSKVWINDSLAWGAYNKERFIEIIKY